MVARVARMDEAEQWISDIEDKIMENNEAEKKGEQRQKIIIQDFNNSVTY